MVDSSLNSFNSREQLWIKLLMGEKIISAEQNKYRFKYSSSVEFREDSDTNLDNSGNNFHNHNNQRVDRILIVLKLFGLDKEYNNFFGILNQRYKEHPSVRYWKKQMKLNLCLNKVLL